jgi:hypothetical protein
MFAPYHSGLIAVSSHRPNATGEVADNQSRAKRSWDAVFDRIFLFGPPDKRLASPITEFIACEDFPCISLLLLVASRQREPVCILNADIVVAPSLKNMLNEGWKRNAMALTSRRFEFDPADEDYDRAKVVDLGADFFAAFPAVWGQAYKAIPATYRISGQQWDSWILAFLTLTLPRRFWDITILRQIFHPKHGDRIRPALDPHPLDRFITSAVGFPPALT